METTGEKENLRNNAIPEVYYLAEKPGFEITPLMPICVYLSNLVFNLLIFVQNAAVVNKYWTRN